MFHKVQKALMLETDVSETVNECIKAVRKRGRIGLIAAYSSYTNAFNIGSLMERGIRLIGNGQAPVHKYWESLLKMIQEKQIHPSKMVTHRVSLDDLDKVYYKFEEKADGMQKVFVETKWSFPASASSPPLTRY